MTIEQLKLENNILKEKNNELMKLYEAVLQGRTFRVDKEKRLIQVETQQDRRNGRIERYYTHLVNLKDQCEKPDFRRTIFCETEKVDPEFFPAVYKIGLMVECGGSAKRPKYKWGGGNPTREDAKFIIELMNDKAKERRCLT